MQYFISTFLFIFSIFPNLIAESKIDETKDKENLSVAQRSVAAEGATLPKGVIRARAVLSSVTSSKTFDKDANEIDSGLSLKATGGAFVAEYGLFDNLSLQLLQKVVYSAKWDFDESKFKNSKLFSYQKERYIKTIKDFLESLQISSDAFEGIKDIPIKNLTSAPGVSDTLKNILNAGKFPYPGTADIIELDTSLSISENIDNLILQGAQSSSDSGGFRLGDLELGLLYSLFNDHNPIFNNKLHLSFGLGIRFPVGEHPTPSAILPSGNGITDLGFRINLDYFVSDHFLLSWENQTEIMLVKGSYQRTSVTNNQEFETSADGSKQSVDYEKEGLAQIGYLKANLGLALFSPKLKAITIGGSFNYTIYRDEKYSLRDTTDIIGTGGHKTSWTISTIVDGLKHHIPLQIELSYTDVLSAKKQLFAANNLEIQLKAFYKF